MQPAPAEKKIDSDFALLDVKRGRRALAARLGPVPARPGDVRIPVRIEGFIVYQHGGDDGTSIEFTVEVTRAVELLPAEAA